MKLIRTSSVGDHSGYTLVELVLVTGVVMFAGALLLRLGGSITGRRQFTTTDDRLKIIEKKIHAYYQAHEQLPAAAPTAGHATATLPVGITQLDLEQKYRLDGWGHYFQYTTSNTNPGSLTGLQDVNNAAGTPTYAASVTCNGPDGKPGTNDDITVYIDLAREAIDIAQRKLKILMGKVEAYNRLFAGIDNDGANDFSANPNDQPAIDEDPLQPAEPPNFGCPPVSGFTNDPADGLPTLDDIETEMVEPTNGNQYACPTVVDPTTGNRFSLAYHLAVYHHLPTAFPGGYYKDPWNRPFAWGYPGRLLDDGSTITKTDSHYHTFYSSGPDPTTITDDIIIKKY